MTQAEIRACWLGGSRYSAPLPSGLERKWGVLGGQAIRPFVVGFHTRLSPAYFEGAGVAFYLLPGLPLALLRYALMFIVAPFLVLWVIMRHDARVIVAQSPYEGAAGAFAKSLARLLGRRVALVVESHGDFENAVFSYRAIRFQTLYRGVMQFVANFALGHADALRAVSLSTRDQLCNLQPHIPTDHFIAWVDSESFSSQPRISPPSASQDILFAGMFNPIKNVHLLIAAFAQIAAAHPDARLWLAGGEANQSYVQGLRDQANTCGYGERISFVGMLTQAQLAERMATARFLVLPSKSEGLPRIIIEAMYASLPVIASRVGGIPDIVQDGVTGYLLTLDDQADVLARALDAALTNPAIDAMGEAARQAAQRLFSPQGYAAGYRELLEAAIETRGNASARTGLR